MAGTTIIKIKALFQNQRELDNLRVGYMQEIDALDRKYELLASSVYDKRLLITSGKSGLTEKKLESLFHVEDYLQKVQVEENDVERIAKNGVPGFWLTAFKNAQIIEMMVKDPDEPILMYLSDVRVQQNENDMGFTLEFYFDENEYFTNTVLTKEYQRKYEPDDHEYFTFEEPRIYSGCGCTIDWREGKDITTRTLKLERNTKSESISITKSLKCESFFTFFNSNISLLNNKEMVKDELIDVLYDFKVGLFFKERLIPQAALYYIGASQRLNFLVLGDSREDQDSEDN